MKKTILLSLPLCMALAHDSTLVQAIEVKSKLNIDYGSSQMLSKDGLAKTTSKNHTIGEALKSNANISFNNSLENGVHGGEIFVKDISINGAKTYQNNFSIDGINFNNDLNPIGNKSEYKNVWSSASLGSQANNIDTDLLESIEVLDSGISAKYGSFQGGVVNAKTRDPKRGFHGNASLTYTSGDWSKTFIDSKMALNYQKTRGYINRSDFVKKRYRFGVEGYVSDNFGLLFDVVQNNSFINILTKSTLMDANVSTFPDETRKVTNYFVKGIYHASDRVLLKPSYLYSMQTNGTFFEGTLNSNLDGKFGGHIASLEVDVDLDNVFISQNLGYRSTQSSRYFDYKDGYFIYNKSNIKNWGGGKSSSYGGSADIFLQQKSLEYKADFDFNDFQSGEFVHKIATGFSLELNKAKHQVLNPLDEYSLAKELPSGYRCKKDDLTCVNDDSFDGKGQFLSELFHYGETNTKVRQDRLALYLEDEIRYKRFYIRAGIRAQRDSLNHDINIAPRFVGKYDIFNDDKQFIGFGLNRYYGRNLFAYELYNDMYANTKILNRTSPDEPFKQNDQYTNEYLTSALKTPHDDEVSLFYEAELNNLVLNLKFVHRKSKNEVMTMYKEELGLEDIDDETLDDNYKIYTNLGTSKANIFTFNLQNKKPLEFYGTKNRFGLSYTNLHKTSNFVNYNSTSLNKKILLNDKEVEIKDLPVVDYYIKNTIRLNHIMQIPSLNLSFTNFINYFDSKDVLDMSWNKEKKMRSYKTIKIPSYTTWDLRVLYEKKLHKDISFYANLDINNLLNKKYLTNVKNYGLGRNFWLEVGIRW